MLLIIPQSDRVALKAFGYSNHHNSQFQTFAIVVVVDDIIVILTAFLTTP